MLGILLLKLFPYTPALVVLLIGTATYGWYMRSIYFLPSEYLALYDCPKSSNESVDDDERATQEMYQHPALKALEDLSAHSVVSEEEFVQREMTDSSSDNGEVRLEFPAQSKLQLKQKTRQSFQRLHKEEKISDLKGNGLLDSGTLSTDLLELPITFELQEAHNANENIRFYKNDERTNVQEEALMDKPLLYENL